MASEDTRNDVLNEKLSPSNKSILYLGRTEAVAWTSKIDLFTSRTEKIAW